MKLSSFISVVFLLSNISVVAQNEDFILLRPENGKEYFYRFTDLQYMAEDNGNKITEFRAQKVLHITFSDQFSDDKELLQVVVVKNIADRPLDRPRQIADFRYPYLEETYFGNRGPNFFEELICGLKFLYEFDYNTSEIKLFNRPDILLKVREDLRNKGFDKEDIERFTEEFNKKGIAEVSERLNSIFRVSSEFESKIVDNDAFKTTVSLSDSLSQIDAKRWDKKPGLYSINLLYHPNDKYLEYYNRIEIDSTQENMWPGLKDKVRFYKEHNIDLMRVKDISQNRFTISGVVKNSRYKKVTLAVLKNPYGPALRKETVFLDENNTFHIETELEHPEIVLLQLGNVNQSNKLPIFMIYAEPGSKIHLDVDGEKSHASVNFSGDYSVAAEMLYDFQVQYNLFEKTNIEGFSWFSFQSDYEEFEKVLGNYSAFLESWKGKIDKTACEFISNELRAWILSGALYYDMYSEGFLGNGLGRLYFSDPFKVNAKLVKSYIDNISINDIYNEYGVFSRHALRGYISSKIRNTSEVSEFLGTSTILSMTTGNFFYLNEFPLDIEVAKTILAGHAYYSYAADMLFSTVSQQSSKKDGNSFGWERLDDYANLMLRVCNDAGFKKSVKNVQNNYKNWESDTYIPPVKFFNEKGEASYMKDFFGEKPTVFYISKRWDRERYYFDMLAKENPELNFVMVMEGSNFTEWVDYIKRAEPVARQLLLLGPELNLVDVFKRNSDYYIAYDKNGKILDQSTDAKMILKVAKESLLPKKKQLNKSQLWLIILLLVITLTVIILSWIVWKWRVRQKFRKEQKQRRLRELELTAIRSQMNPHFLFNSLNSVQNLVQQNKGREAHLYLSDFAGLIRKVLNNSEKEEVSLAEELEMINQYLNLEKLRFDFEYTISVDHEVDTHNTMVPSMLMQPFVENAIIHGLQNKTDDRKLRVEIEKEHAGVKICIEDNGIGREAARGISREKNGKGTKLVKERLEILQQKNKEKYELKVIDLGDHSGTRVEIRIPEEL